MSRAIATADQPVRTLVVVTLCNSAAVLPAGLTVILAVQIRSDLGVTPFQFGLGLTVYSAGIALLSATMGRLADRLGWYRSVLASLAVSTAVLAAIAAFAGSLVSLLPLLFLAGTNVAFTVPATALTLAQAFPSERRGATFGVKEASISITFLLAGLAVPAIALTVGWRWAFVAGFVLPITAVGLLFTRGGSPARDRSPAGGRSSIDRHAISEEVNPGPAEIPGGFRLLALATALAAASVSGVVGFAVLSAVEVGMSEASAGLLIAAASVAGIVSDIGVGLIADRRRSGGFPEATLVLALGAVGYAILILQTPIAAVVGTFFGYMFGWAFSGLLHLGAVTSLPAAPAAATGTVQVGAGIGLTVGPITFGTLLEIAGYRLAWATMALLAVAAAATVRTAAGRLPPPRLTVGEGAPA